MSFDDFGLKPSILKAIAECGYDTPTPIQEQSIPIILMMRDMIGLAQTGTGKTASFVLPMIEVLAGGQAKARMPRSLILCPTRELAAQAEENFLKYSKYERLNSALLVGGESVAEQTKLLERGVDVLIATPGRLLDLQERGAILMNDIGIVVIDEADRMLDMGFIPDIERIFKLLPSMRQTLLFSATMPAEIQRLTKAFLQNPKQVSVAPPASPAKTVEQFLVWCNRRNKKTKLREYIQSENIKNAFVFCNRKKDVDMLAEWLEGKGHEAKALHGDMHQVKRYEVLEDFKSGKVILLVCSDVAARGLDVSGVSHVFNYDVPMSAEDYVHRIGRTGRAGIKGRAWTLAEEGYDDKFIDGIEKLIGKPIPVEEELDGNSKSGSETGTASKKKSTRTSASKNAGKGKPHKQKDSHTPRGPKQKEDFKNKHDHKSNQKPRNNHKKNESKDEFGDRFDDDIPAFLR
jgi:superfamily II DNA/RNA helicase